MNVCRSTTFQKIDLQINPNVGETVYSVFEATFIVQFICKKFLVLTEYAPHIRG